MMQGLHHQQQQLAALLSVALAKDDPASASSAAGSAASTTSEAEESNRLTAINSLHRLVLYPPNSVLVAHSAAFLFQGFSQLLVDK